MTTDGATCNLPQPPPGLPHKLVGVLGALCNLLMQLKGRHQIAAIQQIRGYLDAIEASTLAALMSDADDLRSARLAASTRHRSRADVFRSVQRARLVKGNPALQADLAVGAISSAQLDVVASASRRSRGAAANDSKLVGKIKQVSPDQGRKIANSWLAQRLQTSDTRAAHAMARDQRNARRASSPDGLAMISLAGDDITIEQAWSSIESLADQMYHDEGGRETPDLKHERTKSQRLYDAAIEHFTTRAAQGGPAHPRVVITVDARDALRHLVPSDASPTNVRQAPGEGASDPRVRRVSATDEVEADEFEIAADHIVAHGDGRGVLPLPPATAAGTARTARTARTKQNQSKTSTHSPGPAEIHISLRPDTEPIDPIQTEPIPNHISRRPDTEPVGDGIDRDVARHDAPQSDPPRHEMPQRPIDVQPQLVGVGPIPNSELERILCNCALTVLATDKHGQPLWLSRTRRTATAGQRLALIARDKSCVLCDSHHRRCEAHHIIPFNASAKGRTDIDNLALVCQQCHRQLHDEELTLEANIGESDRHGTGSSPVIWSTRPARPHEIAPRQRPTKQRPAEQPSTKQRPTEQRPTDHRDAA